MRVIVLHDAGDEAVDRACAFLIGVAADRVATTDVAMRSKLDDEWDAVVVVWSSCGSSTVETATQARPRLPCVVVAPDGITTAEVVSAMRAGAADVIGPERLAELGAIVANTIPRSPTSPPLDGLGLPHGDAFFRWATETTNIGIVVIDARGTTTYVNGGMAKMLGCSPAMATGRHVGELLSEQDRAELPRSIESMRAGQASGVQVRYRRLDGSTFPALLESAPIFDTAGRFAGGLSMVMDISAWHAAEERCEETLAQLRQSQKMEAVGRLAGGVAHDFNNMLSVILGYGDSILERVGGMPDVRDEVAEIIGASRRAAELTRQLLVFSRRHVVKPTVFDLSELVAGMQRMIERLVGEDIELVYRLGPFSEPPLVEMDASGMEQVLLNLVVNARDAMPTGGRLAITLAERGSRELVLAARDSGCGMDAATAARAFDPFFTTKPQGTGLGLSTVYGIVEQAAGTLRIESAPQAGATIEVVLPRATAQPHRAPLASTVDEQPSPSATILLVEDDAQVRAVTRRGLERQGHRVVEARGPLEALERDLRDVDVLLTDVVMPQMGGAELARRLRAKCPTLKVIFMSGYNDDNVLRHGVVIDRAVYLPKPFTPTDLSQKVREALAPSTDALTGAA